jgi:hypothetical protein
MAGQLARQVLRRLSKQRGRQRRRKRADVLETLRTGNLLYARWKPTAGLAEWHWERRIWAATCRNATRELCGRCFPPKGWGRFQFSCVFPCVHSIKLRLGRSLGSLPGQGKTFCWQTQNYCNAVEKQILRLCPCFAGTSLRMTTHLRLQQCCACSKTALYIALIYEAAHTDIHYDAERKKRKQHR